MYVCLIKNININYTIKKRLLLINKRIKKFFPQIKTKKLKINSIEIYWLPHIY